MSESSATDTHDSPGPGVIADVPHVQRLPDAPPQRTTAQPPGPPSTPEPRGARIARSVRHVRLYLYAFFGVALIVYVVALAGSNTHHVRVDWVFGSSSVSLVWLVLLAVILGWLLGLLVGGVFRWRTRAPRPS
jgi:uncharacterized integral membrane protein